MSRLIKLMSPCCQGSTVCLRVYVTYFGFVKKTYCYTSASDQGLGFGNETDSLADVLLFNKLGLVKTSRKTTPKR